MLNYFIIFALLAFSNAAPSEKVTYENFKLLRVLPTTSDHVESLKKFESDDSFQYWRGPSHPSKPADIMVSPSRFMEFQNFVNSTGMKYEIVIDNLQNLINEQSQSSTDGGFSFDRYHTLDQIYEWLDSLGKEYPDKVQVIDMGKSYENRVIKGVKLSFGPNKPGIFIEGGIHAREWISPATVTYILNELLTSKDPEIRRLADTHDWYLVPSFNPDGYVYTHESNRLWRKTRSGNGMCKGADPNRNWGFKWMGGGASSNPCAETYAGDSAFSEPETKSMSEYITSIKDNIFAYIAFHSYSQLLMFPYGHTSEHLGNHAEEKAIGTKAITALAQRYRTYYVTGNIAETIYIASGSSMDWVKGTLKLPVTFTYELRDTGRYGFLLPPSQIVPNGQEVMDSLVAMFKEASRFGYPKPQE